MSPAANTTSAVNETMIYIVAWAVFMLCGITAAMLYFVFRYNRKRTKEVANIEGNATLEWVWTAIPTVIVLSMFVVGWKNYWKMRVGSKEALVVEARGVKWAWSFRYQNGAVSDKLRLPLGQPVRINTTSADVIHSLYIPAFRIKQDAIPGRTNHIYVTPERVGVFDLFCAEYCGDFHSKMMTQVVVMPRNKFDAWYKQNAQASAPVNTEGKTDPLLARGIQLSASKGCRACHSLDGTKLAGPSWKGIYGHKVTVVEGGQEKTIKVDDAYLTNSILNPNAQLVKGFTAMMPSQKGQLTADDVKAIIAYIKTVK